MGEAAGAGGSFTPATMASLGGLYGGPLGYAALGGMAPPVDPAAAAPAAMPTPPALPPPPASVAAPATAPVPAFTQPTADPGIAIQKAATDQATIQSLMNQARDATARILAQYGSKLSLGMVK